MKQRQKSGVVINCLYFFHDAQNKKRKKKEKQKNVLNSPFIFFLVLFFFFLEDEQVKCCKNFMQSTSIFYRFYLDCLKGCSDIILVISLSPELHKQ